MSMTSSRPYLIRALYEWILDNDCTPHILVHADAEGVDVPQQYVQDGQIVLNIAPTAVVDLLMDNQAISFNARFGGTPTDIYIPVASVIGIITRENGQGMMFDFNEPQQPPPTGPEEEGDNNKPAGKPTLKIVK